MRGSEVRFKRMPRTSSRAGGPPERCGLPNGHGVPWNNNNSEHAIKPFARYRAISDGQMSEPRLRDYLVLLTLYQTCKYRGISFLRFLLSQNRNIDKFQDSGKPRYPRISLQIYPEGLSSTAQQSRSKK